MILRAAWVLPISAPPIRDGFVGVVDGRIVNVGAAAEAARIADEDELDLGDAALLPGLVNPHTHLELSAYAGKLPPMPLWEWFRRLIPMRRAAGRQERESAGVEQGAWECLCAGVTCVGDISRESISWRVLKSLPIRKVCFAELLSLADDPPRTPAELAEALAEIEEDELLTAGVTPHAPYTVPEADFRAALELAREEGRPWTTHWAETREEVAFLAGNERALPEFLAALMRQRGVHSPKLPAIEYLARCTRGLPPGIVAHLNYVDADEVPLLCELGHYAVYCPRAHRFFGHSPHLFGKLRSAGVRLLIGTDSAASNESLALLDELAFVQTHLAEAPSADELLRMTTLEAAKALGLEERIGSLDGGKYADLAAFPCRADVSSPADELIRTTPAANAVWVAGRRVV